ncbi:MAG: hypothetical protein ABIP95_10935 [Pelobium sp.]
MKRKTLNILTIAIVIITWLFVGIKKDDEFEEHDLFFKYKPSLQVYFKSPLGMQDMPSGYPAELFVEEAVYDEFVNEKHYSDSGVFPYLAGILVLLSLGLLTASFYKYYKR